MFQQDFDAREKSDIKIEPMDDYPDISNQTTNPTNEKPSMDIEQESESNIMSDNLPELTELADLTEFSEVYNEPDTLNLQPEKRAIFFTCRICTDERKIRNPKKFSSIIALTTHLHNHTKRCPDCRQVFKSWKKIDEHEPYCPRRFGVHDVRPDRPAPLPKPVKTPFRCQLCNRKYEKKQHLIDHQINRCTARYKTHAWIVKI